MATGIDTANKFLVGGSTSGVTIMMPPRGIISNEDALLLAAWLVAIAEDKDGRFQEILGAVQNT